MIEVVKVDDMERALYDHDPFQVVPSFWNPWSGRFDCLCR